MQPSPPSTLHLPGPAPSCLFWQFCKAQGASPRPLRQPGAPCGPSLVRLDCGPLLRPECLSVELYAALLEVLYSEAQKPRPRAALDLPLHHGQGPEDWLPGVSWGSSTSLCGMDLSTPASIHSSPLSTGSSLPSLAVVLVPLFQTPQNPCSGCPARLESECWRGDGSCRWGTLPVSVLFTTSHFLPLSGFPTVVASVFSSLLSLSVSFFLSLFLQPLATLSSSPLLVRLALPISPSCPRPLPSLEAQGLCLGASQPGLGALSGRQWCRRPRELRQFRRA